MLQNTSDLKILVNKYLEEFNSFCEQNELVGKVAADHVGLKCSTKAKYEFQRELFEVDSRFLYQSIISKRRISIIGLNEGLETVVGPLNYLELSDQKSDGSQIDLIDHLEIVPITISYEGLLEIIKNNGIEVKEIIRPHHTTHDVVLPSGFIVRLSHEMLIDKIKREEMV